MYIGIKSIDMDNFERVAAYIVKNLEGKKVNNVYSAYSFYKVNKISKDDLVILYYYLEKEMLDSIKILAEI
jgi:aspartate 1-decarboxylase